MTRHGEAGVVPTLTVARLILEKENKAWEPNQTWETAERHVKLGEGKVWEIIKEGAERCPQNNYGRVSKAPWEGE